MILMDLSVTVCVFHLAGRACCSRQLHDPGGIVPCPSPPRSLGGALARQRSRSTALSQRVSLSRSLALLSSCSAALLQRVLLGHTLAASLTRWVRVRPALLFVRTLPGLNSSSSVCVRERKTESKRESKSERERAREPQREYVCACV